MPRIHCHCRIEAGRPAAGTSQKTCHGQVQSMMPGVRHLLRRRKMYLSTVLITVCMLIAGTPREYVPDNPDTLDVAIVTSGRNEHLSVSAPVRTMAASGILRSGARNLDEVLKTFAGVSVKDYGGIGGLKTVSVRNLGSQHTAVSYDGIPVTDAQNGQVDIGRFNLDNVSRITVSIGGTDDIFRSARHLTSAGILEINSVKPDFAQGPVQIDARMGVASFGTYSPYILYRQRLCRGWALSASANYISSKGNYPFVLHNGNLATEEKRRNSDVSSLSTEINVSGDMGRGGELAVKAYSMSSERGLPGQVILYTENTSERLWDRSFVANAMYTNNIGTVWRVRTGLCYSRAYNRCLNTDAAYAVPADDRYTQQEYSFSAIIQCTPLKSLRLVLAEDFFVNSLDSNIPECLFPVRFSSMTSLSAQYTAAGRFTATAGLVGTFSHETVSRGIPAPDRRRLSPFAGISYKILRKEDLRIRASFRDGFRMPTFNDLYYARVGNASLAPEKALQANLGVTWERSFRKWSLALAADGYYNTVRDKIVAIPTMFIWKMRNVGRVQMAGMDITASFRFSVADRISVGYGAGYSYQYAVDVTDPLSKNYRHQIPYVPVHTGNMNLCLETSWANVSYSMSAVGERFSLSQNLPMNRIAPYIDHGISVNRTFGFGSRHRYGLYVSAEVLNIGNSNYEIIRYYPMPGRSCRLTVKIMY